MALNQLVYIAFFCLLCYSVGAIDYRLTRNQIIEDIKYLSQHHNGFKPSRLRSLLLADLNRALEQPIDALSNCTSYADLHVKTINCTSSCHEYRCSTGIVSKLINHGKRSRLIQKNCEQVCCNGKKLYDMKSINLAELTVPSTYAHQQLDYDRFNRDIKLNDDCRLSAGDIGLTWIVQIMSVKNKAIPQCAGILIKPNLVLTTLVCVSQNSNVGDLEVKVRNNDGTVEIRKVIERTIARNYTQWFQEDGFNLGLLRLEPSNSVSQPLTFNASSCLGSQTINKSKNRRCFVVNLIKRDDRIIELREEVAIYPPNECDKKYRVDESRILRFGKSKLCAGRRDGRDLQTVLTGSPLICFRESNGGTVVHLNGLLAWSMRTNKLPHIFTNVKFYEKWLAHNS